MSRSRATAPLFAALTTFVALSSTLLGGPAAAAADAPAVDSVLVTGTGEVSGEPDTVTADFAVEITAAAVDDAMTRAGTAATRVRDALLHAGVARADLQTSNVNVGAQRNDDGNVTGYTVSQGITATIRSLPQAGAVLSAAIAAGGDAARLNGVWYSIEDDTALLSQARKLAFADARAKAQQYAQEAGRPLGRVMTVSEVPFTVPVSGGFDYRSGADAPAAPMPVEPGRQRLSVTVTVEWALPPAPDQHASM
ncbi:SIMPL domain-containing protein [Dactylosporangium vinaceum]|uniref:SIMPL domain-containing protein n=1 Tax=Dactylosporangium vinaceum TaxID=53362 RepID=A0ABV5LZE6_9ACTN|nr:SIMPL domain-containing protein [Dactylosporangium vinaceum]UAB92610.1 SIMPL domain-containing protein [Dactylosporangium vinaceum]